jgi:hypothetical protein
VYEWDGLVESGRKVAGLDPALAGDDELFEAARALETLRSLVDAAESHVLAELDARGACDAHTGLSTGTWLAREAGLPLGVARNRVRVGVGLRARLGAVDEALVEGRISFDHARVLTDACNPRVADQVTAIQDQLIELADHTVFERWRREIHGIVELLDQDGGHDPNDDLARNQLSVSASFDGAVHLTGTLVGADALVAHQAIDAKADELFHRFSTDHDRCPELTVPTRATLRALAFAELCRTANATPTNTNRAPRPDVTLVVTATEPTRALTPTGTPSPTAPPAPCCATPTCTP